MKIIALIITLFMLSSCSGTREKSSEERAFLHLKLGSKYLVAGHYPEALRELIVAEKHSPENPKIQNNLGIAYFVRSKYLMAETKFLKAIELKNDYTEARNNLGKTYISLHQYDRAIKVLKKSTEDLTFKHPEKSWANLGNAYFQKGSYKNALNALRKSLEIRPKSCSTFVLYGRSLFELKDFSKSTLAFEQAIDFCKKENPSEAKYYSSISHFRLGQKRKAIARLEEILSLNKNDQFWHRAEKLLNLMKQQE